MYRTISCIVVLVFALILTRCGQPKTPAVTQPEFTAGIETIDSTYVASLSVMGPYSEMGKSFAEIMAWFTTNKIEPMGAPFGIFYDDPTKVKPESTRYEICFPVASQTKGDDQVKVKKLDPVQVAATIYAGPYDKIGETYGKLFTWITDNKYQVVGAPHEFYLNDPAKVPAESLKTKVAIPVVVVPGEAK